MTARICTLGFDIEGGVRTKGKRRFACEYMPETEPEFFLAGAQARSPRTVRLYSDGAVAEVGTASAGSCLSWHLDSVRMAIFALGDTRLGRISGQGDMLSYYLLPEQKHYKRGGKNSNTLEWADMVRFSHAALKAAPPRALESGCHPRISAAHGEEMRTIPSFIGMLRKDGHPCGGHMHFGNPTLAGLSPESKHDRVKALVSLVLPLGMLTGVPGVQKRWKYVDVGYYRTPLYGIEWTDPGLSFFHNMLICAAAYGMARTILCEWTRARIAEALRHYPFERTRSMLLDGSVQDAKDHLLAAHDWARSSSVHPETLDDTLAWSGPQWRTWSDCLRYGFPDDGLGYWRKHHGDHVLGLSTGFLRITQEEWNKARGVTNV